jgi:phospholipid/cholesterol/gamma-HCH transport system ATP-binding protein
VVAAGIDRLILDLKKAFKMTIVIVTHELASVEIIADKIAMMHEGVIRATGSLEELKSMDDQVIQQFFNREPDDEEVDRERQISALTGGA